MVGRSIAHLVAYLVACLAFGLALVSFVITPVEIGTGAAGPATDRLGLLATLGLASATQAALFAAPLALVGAILAEWRRIRDWSYYVLLAMAAALAGFAAQYLSEQQGQPTIVNNYALIAFLTAGFTAGLVYWIFAGRSAGRTVRPQLEVGLAEQGPSRQPLARAEAARPQPARADFPRLETARAEAGRGAARSASPRAERDMPDKDTGSEATAASMAAKLAPAKPAAAKANEPVVPAVPPGRGSVPDSRPAAPPAEREKPPQSGAPVPPAGTAEAKPATPIPIPVPKKPT